MSVWLKKSTNNPLMIYFYRLYFEEGREVTSTLRLQSCKTLTDMRLTEFMGFMEKRATTKLLIQ